MTSIDQFMALTNAFINILFDGLFVVTVAASFLAAFFLSCSCKSRHLFSVWIFAGFLVWYGNYYSAETLQMAPYLFAMSTGLSGGCFLRAKSWKGVSLELGQIKITLCALLGRFLGNTF
ncbi:hypothetical protein NG799_21740 [Laspinema sp. D1]|uniref:Uncharacterized protein n=1 Tax=Laspinema palackyanum D2a TaxID=2953684 RepID=A0ABT2MW20_9CYAN|nr:hypothetical protein [Laspinema sp. D2a]